MCVCVCCQEETQRHCGFLEVVSPLASMLEGAVVGHEASPALMGRPTFLPATAAGQQFILAGHSEGKDCFWDESSVGC